MMMNALKLVRAGVVVVVLNFHKRAQEKYDLPARLLIGEEIFILSQIG